MDEITFRLNDQLVSVALSPGLRLLDVLREHLHLTGVKEGCGEGECGACSVLLNGRIINSCCLPLANVHGQEVMTIEGFARTPQYRVLVEAFAEEGGSQCGICTPGMLLAAESLLRGNNHPSEEEIRIGISGNLCRCTGYNMIIKAIQRAVITGDGLW